MERLDIDSLIIQQRIFEINEKGKLATKIFIPQYLFNLVGYILKAEEHSNGKKSHIISRAYPGLEVIIIKENKWWIE